MDLLVLVDAIATIRPQHRTSQHLDTECSFANAEVSKSEPTFRNPLVRDPAVACELLSGCHPSIGSLLKNHPKQTCV
ncbi:hypothetical protein Pla52n_50220 [Stieleria varia]|uniref:Uncharacterized protein n=1 Tax=Stieleria varia TaxID=2528005 RepID=A0A5C6AGT1_9BACT|nr:hypothetical protein Pla52n_50220 [Stieleria varia]